MLFSAAPTPRPRLNIFSAPPGKQQDSLFAFKAPAQSPLLSSSSPLRPPSPTDPNVPSSSAHSARATQSSPIGPSSLQHEQEDLFYCNNGSNKLYFGFGDSASARKENSCVSNSSRSAINNNRFSRFAGRYIRPNPLLGRGRDDLRETRRRLFLQEVRNRGEEKRWNMRGGDDEILKVDFLAMNRDWKARKEEELAGFLGPACLDADIDDFADLQSSCSYHNSQNAHQNEDELVELVMREQEELETKEQMAMAFSQQSTTKGFFCSTYLRLKQPEDELLGGDEYDKIFEHFIRNEQCSGPDLEMG